MARAASSARITGLSENGRQALLPGNKATGRWAPLQVSNQGGLVYSDKVLSARESDTLEVTWLRCGQKGLCNNHTVSSQEL